MGSLKDNGGPGYGAIKNMLDFGSTGKTCPVKPSGGEILGLAAYSSLDEVKRPVDLAMVIILHGLCLGSLSSVHRRA